MITREEAIKHITTWMYATTDLPPVQVAKAFDMALAALRPVSREQVEKWKGEWNYSHKTKTDGFAVVQCSKCGQEAFALALYVKDGNFCPYCGAPMTDEAVDMVMERLEALYGQASD